MNAPKALPVNDLRQQGYYPFGMVMKGRAFSSEEYPYSFTGKEQDNEIRGTYNSINFGERIYDSRVAQWFSIDPLHRKHPCLSPYIYANNSPVFLREKDGKDFELQVDHDEGTILVTANIYTINTKSHEQALNGAEELNNLVKKVSIDGKEYTLSFSVNVIKPAVNSYEEAKARGYSGDPEAFNLSAYNLAAAQEGKNTDPIGNLFENARGSAIKVKFREGEIQSIKGGKTGHGNWSKMNKIEYIDEHGFVKTYDMGDYQEVVSHELLHLFGLDDKGGMYYSRTGRMNYTGAIPTFNFKDVSSSDIHNILQYALDHDSRSTDKYDTGENNSNVTIKQSGSGNIKTATNIIVW